MRRGSYNPFTEFSTSPKLMRLLLEVMKREPRELGTSPESPDPAPPLE